MGLFTKKAGGTFFGNLLRTGAGVLQSAGGVSIGAGAGANMVAAGQKYTNKQIEADPGKYITRGERFTNGEIDAEPALSMGYYISGNATPPAMDPVKVPVFNNPITSAINTVKETLKNAAGTAENANKVSAMMKWAIPVGLIFGLVIVIKMFFVKKRGR